MEHLADPLHSGNEETIRYLCSKGANVNAKDLSNNSPRKTIMPPLKLLLAGPLLLVATLVLRRLHTL